MYGLVSRALRVRQLLLHFLISDLIFWCIWGRQGFTKEIEVSVNFIYDL